MSNESIILENSNQLNMALKLLRQQAEDTARKDRISKPNQEVRNTNARRRDSYNSGLVIGSTMPVDISSSSLIACNVIRIKK